MVGSSRLDYSNRLQNCSPPRGSRGTKVRDIADAVGILSGSLYHYFPSKDAIANTIVTQYLQALTSVYGSILESAGDPRTRLGSLVRASFQVSQAHPHASEIYQNNSTYLRKLDSYHDIREAARSTKDAWIAVIESGMSAGEFRSDLPAEILYGLIRDAVWLSLRWFSPQRSSVFQSSPMPSFRCFSTASMRR